MAESNPKDQMDPKFDQALDVLLEGMVDSILRTGISLHMRALPSDTTPKTSTGPAVISKGSVFQARIPSVGRGRTIGVRKPVVSAIVPVVPARLPAVGRGIAIKDWKKANIKPTIRKFAGCDQVLSGRIVLRQSDMRSKTLGKAVNPPSASHTMECLIEMKKPPKNVITLQGADCFDFISDGMSKRKAGFCWKTSFHHPLRLPGIPPETSYLTLREWPYVLQRPFIHLYHYIRTEFCPERSNFVALAVWNLDFNKEIIVWVPQGCGPGTWFHTRLEQCFVDTKLLAHACGIDVTRGISKGIDQFLKGIIFGRHSIHELYAGRCDKCKHMFCHLDATQTCFQCYKCERYFVTQYLLQKHQRSEVHCNY